MPGDDTVKKVIEEVLLESNKRKGTVHPSPSQQATISASPTINPANPNPSALSPHPQVEFKTASDIQYAAKYMRLSQGLASKDLKINPNATNITSTNAAFTPSSIKTSHASKSQGNSAAAGEEKNLPSKKSKKSMGDSTVTLGLSSFVGIKSILVQLQQTQQHKDTDDSRSHDSTMRERNQKPSDTSQYNLGKGKAGGGGGHTLGTESKTQSQTSTNTGNTNKSYQSQSAGIKSQTSANNMGNPNKNVTSSTTGNSNRTNTGAGSKAQTQHNAAAAGNKYKHRTSNAVGKSQTSNQNNAVVGGGGGGNKNKKRFDKFDKESTTGADSKNTDNSKNNKNNSGVSHVQIEIIRQREPESERYNIIGHSGNILFYARDDTKKFKRKYCGADRPFLVTILSPDDDEEILTIERRCNCFLCFWGGNTWGSNVVIKSSLTGVVLGEVIQQFSLRTSKFVIKDDDNSGGEMIMKIEGTNCGHIWPCIPHWQDHEEFKVFTLSSFIHYQNQNNFVGTIMDYGRRGQKNTVESASELYGMLVPPELSPRLKAVLLGAIFNIAFTVFQKNRPLNAVCRTVTIFTVLILLVIIIIVACSV